MKIAITRAVSPGIVRCELTHIDREPIDLDRARSQHRRYEQCLSDLGCRVESLPEDPDLPDSVFVEDVAVVVDELAILTRPGAESRRAETKEVARALGSHRKLDFLSAPATMDGGDVLVAGRKIYVGRSRRTNADGIEQMRRLLQPHGYSVIPVPVRGCLHLKSAVTRIGPDLLLLNREWVEPEIFDGMDFVEVDPAERYGANALLIGSAVIHPSLYPRTRRRLEERGVKVVSVDVSEILKAEGAVTCCSLVFDA